MSSLPGDREARKRLGAWYTPLPLVDAVLRWAIRSPDNRVFDPAIGDGDFLLAGAGRLRALGQRDPGRFLFGVDVSEHAVATTAARLRWAGEGAKLIREDFFGLDPPSSLFSDVLLADAVVGNPPYIRYQRFSGDTRERALGRARQAGVELSGLSSAWAPFVVHASTFLRQGGRLGLVLPEELIHSNYARAVREFLRKTFRAVTVLAFDSFLFPRSQERVVLLLADGKGVPPAGELRVARAPGPECLEELDYFLAHADVFRGSDGGPDKWLFGSDDAGAEVLDELAACEKLVPLARLGKTGIGYVSGANDYFVLRPSEARDRAFPATALRPTVVAARQTPGARLTVDDLAELTRRDEKCFLWVGEGRELPTVAKYIQEGEAQGLSGRYKCRTRDPWYVVPGVRTPQAFLTYMSHQIPRLVWNAAGSTHSNNLLGLALHPGLESETPEIVAAFYNSATMLSAERVGRHYGGGVLKLEPSEADRVLVPNPTLGTARAAGLLDQVDALLRSRSFARALALVDGFVLSDVFGLNPTKIQALRESHERRRTMRAGKRTVSTKGPTAAGPP